MGGRRLAQLVDALIEYPKPIMFSQNVFCGLRVLLGFSNPLTSVKGCTGSTITMRCKSCVCLLVEGKNLDNVGIFQAFVGQGTVP